MLNLIKNQNLIQIGKAIVFSFILISPVSANSIDGDWELKIIGNDNLDVGSQYLAGGLKVNWSNTLLFSIRNGQFTLGTGLAELSPKIESYSRPENIFECINTPGTFVSKTGQLFKTPHLRFVSFPVTGQVQHKKKGQTPIIKLVHGMEYPGNYYSVLFECKTKDKLGKNWLESSPRVAKQKANRQSISTKFENDFYVAKVKQVKAIGTGPELIVPLLENWTFTWSDSFGDTTVTYELSRKQNK